MALFAAVVTIFFLAEDEADADSLLEYGDLFDPYADIEEVRIEEVRIISRGA